MGKMGASGIGAAAFLATVLTFLFVAVWLKGRRFSFLIDNLDYRKHPFKDLYLFGLEALDMIRYGYSSLYDRKIERCMKKIHGEQYAEYYRRIAMAQKISVSLPVCVLLLVISTVINDWLMFVFSFIAAGGTAYYFDRAIYDVISRRGESISREIPEVLTELTLLVNAGMVLRDAWRKTAGSGDGVLHAEMLRTAERIDNGVPEFEAYREFAERCGDQYIDKIISAMMQNLTKGNRELVEFLRITASECWSRRKQAVLRKGEEASTKLLLPIGLMFLGILLMIMLPIMGNIAF